MASTAQAQLCLIAARRCPGAASWKVSRLVLLRGRCHIELLPGREHSPWSSRLPTNVAEEQRERRTWLPTCSNVQQAAPTEAVKRAHVIVASGCRTSTGHGLPRNISKTSMRAATKGGLRACSREGASCASFLVAKFGPPFP